MVDAILKPVGEADPKDWQVVPNMAHSPVAQAAEVDRLASEWFHLHLVENGSGPA
jgi:hypothetical protein